MNEKLVAMHRKISPNAKEINIDEETKERTQSECSPSKHNLPGTNTSCRVDAEDEDETASSKEDSGGMLLFYLLFGKKCVWFVWILLIACLSFFQKRFRGRCASSSLSLSLFLSSARSSHSNALSVSISLSLSSRECYYW